MAANTTFLQDVYLGTLLKKTAKDYLKDSSIFVFSDTACPIEMHPGNTFGGFGAYEENFLIPLLLVPPQDRQEFYQESRIVKKRYSQMDLLPTLLDLLGIKNHGLLGNSFTAEILKKSQDLGINKNRIMAIQPFSGGFLAVVEYPFKYIFKVSQNKVLLFNLSEDPLEQKPEIFETPSNFFYLIHNFFHRGQENLNLDKEHIIMHALGGVGGEDYTNSLEAFELNYRRGRRLFEVDLVFTSDNQLVARHDFPLKITSDEFLEQKINGIYTPLSFENILDLMDKYPDVIIITDTKDDFGKSFDEIMKQAESRDPLLFERIVPQVYNEENIAFLAERSKFEKIIYTLYKTEASDQAVYKSAQQNKNIKIVTMNEDRFSEKLTQDLHTLGVEVFVHTLNAGEKITKYLSAGADGIYTDYY